MSMPIKIINLEKRPDRKIKTINEFDSHNIESSNLEGKFEKEFDKLFQSKSTSFQKTELKEIVQNTNNSFLNKKRLTNHNL